MDTDSPDDAADVEESQIIGDWLTEQIFDAQLESVVIDDRFAEMPSEPKTLDDLRPPYHPVPPWKVTVLPKDLPGRLTAADIAVISERPDAIALRISKLDQAGFENMVARYGKQFLAIELEHCPLIADLSPLEDLPGLRLIDISWNQRATQLWNLARTPGLTGLQFEDFTRLHHLRDLPVGESLRELVFGDTMRRSSVFESLDPLAALTGLRSLKFSAKRIDDDRIEPLGTLTGLQKLGFPTSMFTTRQVAWLRARLPDTVRSRTLAPVVHCQPVPDWDDNTDTLLVGKRKPFLNSVTHAKRISKHVDEFWQMVDEFRRDSGLAP